LTSVKCWLIQGTDDESEREIRVEARSVMPADFDTERFIADGVTIQADFSIESIKEIATLDE
jgi:hypothetical protein